MKAWTLIAHGDPKRAFALREHPDPQPGPNQVCIRSEGFGLNYADVMAVRGLYREAPLLPSIIGYETVGRVVAAGLEAPPELIGKRVVAMTRFGGYAEMAVTDHRACAVIPEELPIGKAAALATQGATAWYAARVLCPLHAGERVLVHSAAGGVGHLIVQLAAKAGCEVYAIVGGAAKRELVLSLGAAHAIDRREGEYSAALRKLLGKRRLDASFNAVAGTSFRKDMQLLGSGGRLVLFGGAERGGLGAFGTLRFVWSMGALLPIFLMMKSKSILGVNMLKLGDNRPDLMAHCFREAVAAQAGGLFSPHVHEVMPAEQLPQAHALLASGATMGKVALAW